MKEVKIEHGKPVTNVSVHQIAQPATLRSDQPSLVADPSDNTPPRPTPNSLPASRTCRLTLKVSRLSERKRRRDDMREWKRDTEAKRKSKRKLKQTKSDGTHEGTNTSPSTAAQSECRGTAYNMGRKPICPPPATRRMLLHAHTRTRTRRSRQQEQHRKKNHVVEVGCGWGREDAARMQRDNEKSIVGHTRPRTTWGECDTDSPRDCSVAIRKTRNHVIDVCTISLFTTYLLERASASPVRT